MKKVFARPQSYVGSADIKPIVVGTSILFVQRGANAVHDIRYALENDGYQTTELSMMSSHLFEDKTVVSWAYARNPDSVLWCVMSDGTLIGMTYMREHGVWAWHRHETDGLFESVCAVPGSSGLDEVYFIVTREIEEVTHRYIEQLMPRITDEDTWDYFFVDSGLTYDSSSATTTVTGLDHLEGKTVSVLADGSVLPQKVVTSGSVTLDAAANLVHVGLPYTSDLETLDVNLSDNMGVSQGRQRIIPRVVVSVWKSRGLFIGPNEDNLDEVPLRDQTDLENPIALYTGNVDMTMPSGYDTTGHVFIRNTDPIPLTVLAIMPEVELSEE